MMNRDIKKLLDEYKQAGYGQGTNAGAFYVTDYWQIEDMAKAGTQADTLYNAIEYALKAGFMIGYKKGVRDTRKK